jgi:hypothetical protein
MGEGGLSEEGQVGGGLAELTVETRLVRRPMSETATSRSFLARSFRRVAYAWIDMSFWHML